MNTLNVARTKRRTTDGRTGATVFKDTNLPTYTYYILFKIESLESKLIYISLKRVNQYESQCKMLLLSDWLIPRVTAIWHVDISYLNILPQDRSVVAQTEH